MAEQLPLDRSRPLAGRDLRHAAIAVLERWGPASIGDLLEWLGNGGFAVAGERPNKVLADVLRYEVGLGRVRRLGRGRYSIGRVARTTAWRIRQRWAHATDGPIDPPEPLPELTQAEIEWWSARIGVGCPAPPRQRPHAARWLMIGRWRAHGWGRWRPLEPLLGGRARQAGTGETSTDTVSSCSPPSLKRTPFRGLTSV